MTVSSVIVTDLVPLRDRGVYQGMSSFLIVLDFLWWGETLMVGIMMTVFGAGTLIGGPLAGWLSDHHGWEWSFWIQVRVTATISLSSDQAEDIYHGKERH